MQMYEKKLNELRVGIVFLIEIEKPGEESPLQPSSLSIYQVAENGYVLGVSLTDKTPLYDLFNNNQLNDFKELNDSIGQLLLNF